MESQILQRWRLGAQAARAVFVQPGGASHQVADSMVATPPESERHPAPTRVRRVLFERGHMRPSFQPRLWSGIVVPLLSSGLRGWFMPVGRTGIPCCLLCIHGLVAVLVPLIPILHLLVELLDDGWRRSPRRC